MTSVISDGFLNKKTENPNNNKEKNPTTYNKTTTTTKKPTPKQNKIKPSLWILQ